MRILVLAGPMQAGKTSASNYVTGLVLKKLGKIDSFHIDEEGKLQVYATFSVEGKKFKDSGEWNPRRRDKEYVQGAGRMVWPYIKNYSFADKLKEFCIDVLGLNAKHVYGNKEDKEQLTHIRWENCPGVVTPSQAQNIFGDFIGIKANFKEEDIIKEGVFIHTPGFMTVREVLQYFGSDICRRMCPDCWTRSTYNQILRDESEIAVIDDCRFPNELLYKVEADKRSILFPVGIANGHQSETALNEIGHDKYDYAMPPKLEITLDKKHEHIDKALVRWGWGDLL